MGCHHAEFDSSLQIEPRPMSGREQGLRSPFGGEFGEPVNTKVTAFRLNDDGSYQMEFNSLTNPSITSSIIYRKSSVSDHCWEFEFREDMTQEGEIQTACRDSLIMPPPSPRTLPVHSHTHDT